MYVCHVLSHIICLPLKSHSIFCVIAVGSSTTKRDRKKAGIEQDVSLLSFAVAEMVSVSRQRYDTHTVIAAISNEICIAFVMHLPLSHDCYCYYISFEKFRHKKNIQKFIGLIQLDMWHTNLFSTIRQSKKQHAPNGLCEKLFVALPR